MPENSNAAAGDGYPDDVLNAAWEMLMENLDEILLHMVLKASPEAKLDLIKCLITDLDNWDDEHNTARYEIWCSILHFTHVKQALDTMSNNSANIH